MINLHLLDNTAKNATTPYARFRYDVIRLGEGIKPLPYLDNATAKNPTIGIGFNLRDGAILEKVVNVFGAGAALQDFVRIVTNPYIDDATLRTALNAKMASLHGQGLANRSSFSFSPGAAGIEEMRLTFEEAVKTYEGRVNSWYGSVLPDSSERAILVSLSYNGVLGSKLADAIKNGDRAEAWYQIRYASNGGSSASAGIAKRRYYESEAFGLFDNPSAPTLEEARSAYRNLRIKGARLNFFAVFPALNPLQTSAGSAQTPAWPSRSPSAVLLA